MMDCETKALLEAVEEFLECLHVSFCLDEGATSSADFDQIAKALTGAELHSGQIWNLVNLRNATRKLRREAIAMRAYNIGVFLSSDLCS